jgi:ribonuclease E
MTKRLLIDARQDEETRVVLLNGSRIEDFDYEAKNRKQLKGNVYLARVTRVEPSLQAAFVEYGGNRQGFLAFNEIHPDYYRIPVEDREALIEAETDENDDDQAENGADDAPETVGGEGAEEDDIRPKRQIKKYKIQEVISRKQIMLVQVVKEERGNKGAALTTYLSLAGRYCVLMPNNNRGGGVSRKITNVVDRKRLKTVVGGLDIPTGMAVIVRTAGAKRTKTEITRDYSYLSKLWDDIRTRTLESQAPCLIHEEGDLIKRSIRDLYTSEVEEVLVDGDDAYKTARAQMKMLIPSHLKKVQKYDGETPVFQNFNIEVQMDTIHSPQVTLKSGGYLIINQTEALVAVDVNSGKSTRERNIEETALKTNLEAADELARQLRLRDLSGLIVVDFIDMEEKRNQHAVERRMKDAMRLDRARIQIGSISHFGLLEMSRQRLRISLNESISSLCPHCEGTGRIRSIDTAALQLLRSIEDEAQKGKMDELHITAHRDIVLFILNHKRGTIAEIETRYGLAIVLLSDDSLIAPEYRVEQVGWRGQPQATQNQAKQRQNRRGRNRPHTDQDDDSQIADDTPPDNDNDNDNDNDTGDTAVHTTHSDGDGDDDQPKRRRRGRRGGRRRRRRNGDEAAAPDTNQMETGDNDTSGAASDAANSTQNTGDTTDAAPASKSRAGRGRRRGKAVAKNAEAATTAPESGVAATPRNDVETVGADAPDSEDASPAQPTAKKAASKKTATKKKAAKKALKKAATKATPKTRAKADLDASGDTDDIDKPAKKATKKKAAKKAPKKAATKAADAAIGDDRTAETGTTGSPSTATTASRAPISSTPDDVVEVGGNEPAKPRRGWWSRG